MHGIARRLAVGAAMVLSVGSGITFAAAPASAAGWGCSGSEVSGSPYAVTDSSGTVLSQAHLFWDGSTGTNCAVNVKFGSLYGQSTYIDVVLSACDEDGPAGGDASQCTVFDSQMDPTRSDTNYSSYAGKVTVNGAGHCIMLVAQTADASNRLWEYRSPMFHC